MISQVEIVVVAASEWLIQHGFELNNREWASLFWLGLLALLILSKSKLRKNFGPVIRSALSPKLLIVWVSYILWIAIFVLLANHYRYWDSRLTKDTLVWTVTVGIVLLVGFTDAHQSGFFRKSVWKIAGIVVLMQYLVNLNTFPLIIEILLQPLVLVFATAPILIKTPDDQQKWQTWSGYFFFILTVALLVNMAVFLISGRDEIDWRFFGLRAVWPVGLGLWLLLLLYIWALVASYEQAFLRLNWISQDSQGRWKAKAGLMLELGPRLELVHQAAKGGTYHIAKAESVRAAAQAAREFKRGQVEAKKAEQTYQANLKKFAGNPDVDEQGHPLDKREFRETTNALDWLHTCHIGWFRHAPIGYNRDLLERFGDDFTRQGLSIPSGILMEVADDGTKWYAWRRTPGGHYFAIGASGNPPSQWRYDGRLPPAGYPGDSPEWGESPFDGDAAPNWSR